MSTTDPIAVLLADVDRPVEPRSEFVEAALSELLAKIPAPAPAVAPSEEHSLFRLDWLLPNRSRRVRFAFLLVALLLAVAGIATATYWGVRLVYETPATTLVPGEDQWSNFALAPGGHALYAIRVPRARQWPPGAPEPPAGLYHPGAPQLVRIDQIDRGGELHAKVVLDYADLAEPGMPVQTGSVGGGQLALAPNGDVFFVSASTRLSVGPSLFVLHSDGTRQQILDGRSLADRNLFPSSAATFEVAASAPDRVWLWVGPFEGTGPQRLFELIDPNADSDWSDVIVRPIALPDSLPYAKEKTVPFAWGPAWAWQLAAEPSLPGADRSRSVLAGVLFGNGAARIGVRPLDQTGEFRIYRIGDLNDDGDALDPGEVKLLYDRPSPVAGESPLSPGAGGPTIAPLVVGQGASQREEIVVAGLESADRISLVSDSGAVSDIAQRFPNSSDWPANGLSVVAGPEGELYAISSRFSKGGLRWSVYSLNADGGSGSFPDSSR